VTPLDATGLRYAHPDGTVAAADVDVTVEAGERVALLGPNGAGKSTLVALLGGLLAPDAGEVRYFGATTDADAVRDRLSVLTQHPAEYLFNPTVADDLAYAPARAGLPRDEVDRRVARLAERLDLTDLLSRPPARLSGGERRRAALAAALTVGPDLLLLDEPTSGVDAATRATVLSLLADLHDDGVTVVVSTPDVSLVPHVADRVVLLDRDGAVAARGSVREVLTDAALLRDCGLRPPQVVRLFADRADPPLTVAAARALLDGDGVDERRENGRSLDE
jgi:cobalt/nickel transport system ATP-binding protein